METFDLNGVMKREYPVGNFTWSTANAEGHSIAALEFPKLLFDQAFIKAKIGDFRYFRGGVRLTFRVVTNKFAYGKLIASWIPIAHVSNPIHQTNVYYASGLPHILISASAGEAVTFDAPFISFKRMLELHSYDNAAIGVCQISVLNPLKMVDGTVHSGSVFVTAQFIDPELAVPTSYLTVESAGEADFKTSMHTISDVAESAKAIKSIVQKPTDVAPYVDFITSAIPAAMTLSGLNKPMNLDQNSMMVIHPAPDVNYGKGVSHAQKLSIDPKCDIGTQPIAGVPIDEMDLNVIAGTPQLTKIIALANSTATTYTVDRLEYDTRCYLDHIAKFFSYANGSRKFKIYATASLFHSVRVVFWLNHEATKNDDRWENCYHKVMDIQGDAEMEWTIPYMGAHFARTTEDVSDMHLYCKVLSWNQPDLAQNCPVYLNVYKAGASDFQFYGYLDKVITEANPRADFATPFEFFSDKMTTYGTTNLTAGEKVTSLRELIHQYHPYTNLGVSDRKKAYAPEAVGGKFGGIEKFGQFFFFYRGSMRVRLLVKAANAFEMIFTSIGPEHTKNINTLSFSTNMNPIIGAEIPYYDRDPFRPTNVNDDVLTRQYYRYSGSNHYLLKAAGDDFSFFFLKPLAPTSVIETPATAHEFSIRHVEAWYLAQIFFIKAFERFTIYHT